MRTLTTFHGGIHPPENKAQSTHLPIASAGLPVELILPLAQHLGAPARPVVEPGQLVLKGQCIAMADDAVSAALHAPTSGIVTAIEQRPIPHPSGGSGLCIIIAPDGEERWAPRAASADWRELTPQQLIELVRAGGVVGLGGAGFPTDAKLIARAHQSIDTLVINAAECEPYITADDMLMRERATAVVGGIQILRHITQPRAATLIGIEDNKPEAIAALRAATAGSDIDVVVIPTIYPSGGERQLIQVLTGQEVPSGGLPAEIGVICLNVGTAAAVYDVIERGRPLLSRITTVTGEACRQPRNYEVLIGTPISHLLALADVEAESCARLILGGPMMGYTLSSAAAPIIKTSNCVLASTASELPPPPPAQACIRCGLCAEACPASLLPQQLYWFARGGEHDKLEAHHLFDCIECGACAYVCPSTIPLVHYYRASKAEIRTKQQERAKAEGTKRRFEARQERLAREVAEREARRQARQAAAQTKSAAPGSDHPTARVDAVQAAIERARARKASQSAAQTAANTSSISTSDAAAAAIGSDGELTARQRAERVVAALEIRLAKTRARQSEAAAAGETAAVALATVADKLEQQLRAARAELAVTEEP